MRAWTTSGLKNSALLGLFFACAFPAYAFAAVQFSEVMYDAPGADTGREWTEITNTGSAPVDIGGYKLFESGVNHAVTLVSGTASTISPQATTLAAGESAIIAANPQKFLADYPAYSGALFKSSFSLVNTGGSFALKDKTLAVVDSMSYSSSLGAAGDGNSLHQSAGSWIPGAPNPGSNAPTKQLVKVAPVAAAPAATKTIAKKSGASSAKNSAFSAPSSPNTFGASSHTSSVAAVGLAPLLPNIPSWWLYALSLAALITLGVGAVLYTRPVSLTEDETSGGVEEFELE